MNQGTTADAARTLSDRIRELGFDPEYLTKEEQEEIVDLHALLDGGRKTQRRELSRQ